MLTLEELKARLGAAYVDGFDAAIVQGALVDALGIAEGYIAVRYPLPLAAVPGLVKAAVADIARRRFYTTDTPEDVLTAEKRALELLAAIAAGKVSLLLPATPPPEGEVPDDGIFFESAPLRLSLAQTGLVF